MPALFVYIPYCPSVCTYCDFNVYVRRASEFGAYADAVGQEMALTAGGISTRQIATSFALGGGTPSILTAEQLRTIVGAARRHFDFAGDAEWTLEANPGTVDREKLAALREMGFARLSLGVQTFDDWRLRQFNRDHTVEQAYEAFEWAREVGFQNINLDLIYGLPHQRVEDWGKTLERALKFGSEHLSLYGLQVEERTRLKKQVDAGQVATPDAEVAAEMYELAVERLGAAGFEHYEISNFARRGFESKHNKTYWLNEEYLGFGAGAHSAWQGERYENVKAPRRYLAMVGEGKLPIAQREVIGREMQMAETIFLGLRLKEGVSFERFSRRFGEDARERYREPIEMLAKMGVLKMDAERMWLTEQGMLVSNQLLWRFLPDEPESDGGK